MGRLRDAQSERCGADDCARLAASLQSSVQAIARASGHQAENSDTDRTAFGKSVVGMFIRLVPEGAMKEVRNRVQNLFHELEYLAHSVRLPKFLWVLSPGDSECRFQGSAVFGFLLCHRNVGETQGSARGDDRQSLTRQGVHGCSPVIFFWHLWPVSHCAPDVAGGTDPTEPAGPDATKRTDRLSFAADCSACMLVRPRHNMSTLAFACRGRGPEMREASPPPAPSPKIYT